MSPDAEDMASASNEKSGPSWPEIPIQLLAVLLVLLGYSTAFLYAKFPIRSVKVVVFSLPQSEMQAPQSSDAGAP